MPTKRNKEHGRIRGASDDGKRKLSLPRRFEMNYMDDLEISTPGVAKLRQRYAGMIRHTGADTNLMKQVLCQRFVLLWMELEAIECEAMVEQKRLPPRWQALLNSMTGLAKTLGLEQAQAETVDVHTRFAEILERDK